MAELPDWPGAVIPLVVNGAASPKTEEVLRPGQGGECCAEPSIPTPNLKVAMVGTGGLSHQMIGERAGFNDEKWDREFLDLIERDPERLAAMSVEDFMEKRGNEGAEVIMCSSCAARSTKARRGCTRIILMTTAMAVLFE